jgi:N-acetylneuraminate synthase
MNIPLIIGGKLVGPNHPTFVVAEIGINANGSVDLARKLIDVAASAGADAVKFQKRTIDRVFSREELEKPREVPRGLLEAAIERRVLPEDAVARLQKSEFNDTRNGDQKYALEFDAREYDQIDRYCRSKGVLWSASPWDEDSVDFLAEFDMPFYKVASASLTDDELLRRIRSKGKPVILSTGGSSLEQIRHAVGVLGTEDLIILHCTAAYPKAESERVLSMINLEVIHSLQSEFAEVPIGFSGNDSGIVPAFAAVAMGACVLEKHITLNREMWGSDQASSVEPVDFVNLCRWVREHHLTRGDGKKVVYPEEAEVMKKLRRK